MKSRLNHKQINFWIHEELHQKVKISAAETNIMMKDWVIQAIVERLIKEETYK